MMDMHSESSVMPEDALPEIHPEVAAIEARVEIQKRPASATSRPNSAMVRPSNSKHAPISVKSGTILRKMTRIFRSESTEDENGHHKPEHYRRGSILMKHLETKKASGKATEKDMKFFDVVKNRFDGNIMESRTVISLAVFQTGSNIMDDPFAVIHMPVEIQQGFRRKLFAIFSMQLLVVVLLISFFTYTPGLGDWMRTAFTTWHYLVVTFIFVVLSLIWLYLVKYRFPLNFIVLSVYTVMQSFFFAACDGFFQSKASIFIFGFLLCIMSITTLLCTIITKRSIDDSTPPVLISYPVVLFVSFFLAFIGSLVVYFGLIGNSFSALQYAGALAAVLLLVMWFAYDASCMNERLSPDEYMQGMVFFYTDMVLFLLFLSIIFVACFACEGDCGCYGTADIAPFGFAGGSGVAGGGPDGDDGDVDREADNGGQQ